MKNFDVARIFFEMADILEMKNVEWKPAAYRKAARNIETLSEDVEQILNKGGLKALQEIPGVGEKIAEKIEEFIKAGKVKEYERLKKLIPSGVEEMMHIQGIGPKKAWFIFQKGIKDIKSLEAAANAGKLRNWPGFGEKSEQDILMGLTLLKKSAGRMLLSKALYHARDIIDILSQAKGISKIMYAGSLRRMEETVGDIDILAISDNGKVMDFFTKMPEVDVILAKGPTKSSVVLSDGINVDLRVIQKESYGAALQYFTGNKDHNIHLRNIAIKKGLKLNEYGLYKGNKLVCGKTEEEIYEKLGVQCVPPEVRLNQGEFDTKVPKLIEYGSLKGDLHMHSIWSDGQNTVKDMVKACELKGYEYVGISDHSVSEYVANGMDVKRIKKYIEEINKIKSRIHVLKGSEVSIKADGSMDYPNNILKELDYVIASVHSGFKSSRETMTNRICKALENPYVRILGHPTGRVINQRLPYEVDMVKVIQSAVDNDVWLEIDAYPARLDLNYQNVKLALEMGAKLIIDTDSHSVDHLRFDEFGIAVARKGWATNKSIMNTLPKKEFLKALSKS